MKWKCFNADGRGNGCSHVWTMVMVIQIFLTSCVKLVASEERLPEADAVAEEFSPLPQLAWPHLQRELKMESHQLRNTCPGKFSPPHHRHRGPHFRRQLSPHEQTEILSDLQQNHRFNQQNLANQRPPAHIRQQQFSNFQQQQNLVPTQQAFFNQQQPQFQQPLLTTQQSQGRFSQPQSPILQSLQQSPLSSPQFSSLFSQQPQVPFPNQNPQILNQPSPVELSLRNSPLSNFQAQGIFSQSPLGTHQSPVSTQQSPLTTKQSKEIFSQSVFSTQQSFLPTQQTAQNQQNPQSPTQQSETGSVGTKVKVLKGVSNTEFTIEKSVSDPEELKKVQELELKREKERRERLIKSQEEQLKRLREENERRLKERQEEEKRDEERRLKFLEELKRIEEEKARRRKQEEEERQRLIEEAKERERKRQEEEKLRLIKEEKERQKRLEEERLRKIEEEKERLKKEEEENLRKIKEQQEKQQQQSTNSGVTFAQSTTVVGNRQSTLQPVYFGDKQQPTVSPVNVQQQSIQEERQSRLISEDPNNIRYRQRARLVDNTPGPEGLLLQDERQKLYLQLKEAQKQLPNDEKQQTQETQRVAGNHRPSNQITNKQDPHRTQQSKISQLEKQLQQKQLQDQLQKNFQVQLVQRQDLLRQLKLAVSNAATPTNEDQIVPGPIAVSGGNTSAPLFLANGQKIQIIQSPRQGRPVDIIPKNIPLPTSSISTTTPRTPRASFEELTKGVLPPGADFEVIRHKQDGGLEEIGKQLPQNLPEKKVTFVFLEEQPDGTFKVKGVKGNNNGDAEGDQPAAPDVDSIIKKIQDGDLKLPEHAKSPPAPQSKISQSPTNLPSSKIDQQFAPQSTLNTFTTTTTKPKNIIKTVSTNLNVQRNHDMEFFSSVTIPPLYNVGSSSDTESSFNKQNPQNEFPATLSNSPYSVEVHSGGPNSRTSQDAPSSAQTPHNSGPTNVYLNNKQQQNIPSQYEQSSQFHEQINPVTPFPSVSQYTPTPNSITTHFPPNKYSPQFATPTPKPLPKEPFLPTNPTYINQPQVFPSLIQQKPSQNSPFTPVVQHITAHNRDAPVPGIIYANPTPATPVTANSASPYNVPAPQDVPSPHEQKSREYQQNDEAPSLKTPKRVAAPLPQNSLGEQDKISPLDENGSVDYHTKVEPPQSLGEALKKEGLYAMARFIRESGLNNILNDTGPYTVFAPTDKAFRALLVQLGGPEKAEEKFKENPRLLSGLLLHHIIPGAFELSSLQDEMTGVSLAGTQLRVNAYSTQDVEWNDVQLVTINGARISRDKHDIPIPQGIAHAVEKVMFPLPVGNILQTLKSDRESRFTRFLRALQTSGLSDAFSGNKVYTLFAPTDRAFSVVDNEDLEGLLSDREMSRALVLRHTIPGTLYSSGMRFYQLRDSMEKGSTITLHKTNGQVKANNANVITHNIPTTNGVIHAIDGLL